MIDTIWRKLSWLVPRGLVYWCGMRVIAEATTGPFYSHTIVPELTAMDAIKRFDDETRAQKHRPWRLTVEERVNAHYAREDHITDQWYESRQGPHPTDPLRHADPCSHADNGFDDRRPIWSACKCSSHQGSSLCPVHRSGEP
jgi:hypothetical protein